MNAYATGRLFAALALAGLAACSDGGGNPIVEPPPPVDSRPNHVPPPTMYGPVSVDAIITCTANRSPATVSCSSPQQPAPPAANVTGGKGTHVRLQPSATSYSSGTQIWQTSFSIRNLLVNRIGTADGSTQAGLLAFVMQAPTTTAGTGTVTVANADSSGFFTASLQPYFFYDTILPYNAQAAARVWQFNVPTSVTTFQFKVYVSTPILPMIVFDKDVAGQRHIYRVNLDGTDLTQLTSGASQPNLDPTVARNTVVFTSYRNGNAELYSVALTGGGQTRLTITPTINETAPALSLNGQFLAFISDATGPTKMYIADADATDAELATDEWGYPNHPGVVENSPSWDRSVKCAFTSSVGRTADIYNYTPGVPTPAASPANTTDAEVELSYSHDGNRFTWATNRDGGDTEVYWRQSSSVRLTNHVGIDALPSFLSDGKIVYWVDAVTPYLEWRNPDAPAVATVLPIGAGVVGNPYGVPLWQ